jgi:hypothetical protein
MRIRHYKVTRLYFQHTLEIILTISDISLKTKAFSSINFRIQAVTYIKKYFKLSTYEYDLIEECGSYTECLRREGQYSGRS